VKKIIFSILVLSFFAHHCLLFAISYGSFYVDIDAAQFRYSENENYLEIYYGFNESNLTYIKKNDIYEGSILMNVVIKSAKDDSLIINNIWKIPHTVLDTSKMDIENMVIGVIGLAIPVNSHILTVTVFDENNHSRRSNASYLLEEKQFTDDNISISDIELCSSIETETKDNRSIFYKNTFKVIPNPGNVFGISLPKLYYYVEVYNLLSSSHKGIYQVSISIHNSMGEDKFSKEQEKRRLTESSVETGYFDVSSLHSGSYQFNFTIIDTTEDITAISGKKFFIYNPIIMDSSSEISLSELDIIQYKDKSEAELDREFKMTKYIRGDEEQAHYDAISLISEKRRFLVEFWKKYDPTPETVRNEIKIDYLQKVEYANNQYHIGQKDGWDTDRGRILLTYGYPDEYDRHDSEMGYKPYEIWHYYNIQGGVYFVFGDIFGFGNYILLHSTHRNELSDVNWKFHLRN